jgi:hypothetical protein
MSKFVRHSDGNWPDKLKKRLAKLAAQQEVAVGFPRGLTTTTAKVYPLANEYRKHGKTITAKGFKALHADTRVIGGGASALDVALWNQFGTKHSPARPFMTFAAKPVQEQAKARVKEMVRIARRRGKPLTPAMIERFLKGMGQEAVSIVRATILRDGLYAPNAEITKQRKGSDRPLVNTGVMVKSVAYIVREKTQ